jgi:outer membrane protein OmpA-like peptidoglycan-associated protein
MMIKTHILSSTALATLAIVASLSTARAQVFVGSSQPDVQVNLDALNDLPGGSSGAVTLHAPRTAHHRPTVQYSDATTILGSGGVTRMALETPAQPDTVAPPAKKVAAKKRHRTHHATSAASRDHEGLSPALADLNPAMLTSSDLNRLQILCSGIPTGPRGLSMASYSPDAGTPAPDSTMPVMSSADNSTPVAPIAPQPPAPVVHKTAASKAEFDGVAPHSSADTTRNLNEEELAQATPAQTMGPANIPAPSGLTEPSSVSSGSGEARRPASPAPLSVPQSADVTEPAAPATTDMQMAALPSAPPPVESNVQPTAMTAPPAPEPSTGPLSNADLRVDFQPGGAIVPSNEIPKLDKVVMRLTDNQDLRVELRAFATSGDSASKARRVSLARALAVKSYLTSRGIADERIDVRALGASDANAGDRVDLFLMR